MWNPPWSSQPIGLSAAPASSLPDGWYVANWDSGGIVGGPYPTLRLAKIYSGSERPFPLLGTLYHDGRHWIGKRDELLRQRFEVSEEWSPAEPEDWWYRKRTRK